MVGRNLMMASNLANYHDACDMDHLQIASFFINAYLTVSLEP